MAFGRKAKLILGVLALLGLIGSWQGLRYWWNYAYSRGTRTGVVRKISVKGPPYCKYLAGEMALQGGQLGQPAEVWEFSVDDDHDSNPIVQSLHESEKSGARVTLTYRQDKKMWWRCTPSEYFIVKVEK